METKVKKTKQERRKTVVYWKRSDDDWLFYLNKSYPAENYFISIPANITKEEKIEKIAEFLNIDSQWIEIERKFNSNRKIKYVKN